MPSRPTRTPLTLGITGNTSKEGLWAPVADLLRDLDARGWPVCLHADIADGLAARGLVDSDVCSQQAVEDIAAQSDVLLSFGGDGTLLRAAHETDGHATPILGVNIGRLGFLTKVEVRQLPAALDALAAGTTGVEERMTLDVRVGDALPVGVPAWALNDVVVDKSGTTSMIQIETHVGGAFLNTYWADGLVIATPTGSTAYALSVGGPILAPGSESLVVAPIAPHTLTARPIVLPCHAELTLRIVTRGHPYAFACDGVSTLLSGDDDGDPIRIRRSDHVVRLVTLPGRDFFETVRQKLSWGQGGVF